MWVMTSFGILMPSLRPDGTVPEGDDRVIQVRTRRRQDLEILRTEYMPSTLGPTVYLGGTDYEYRAYCTRQAWAAALAAISLDIDYTKFKPTTEAKYHDKELHNLYNRLWSTIFSTLSTKQHQESYWGGAIKCSRGKALGRSAWWSATDELLLDAQVPVDYEAPEDWYSDVLSGENVVRYKNGKIDHSHCDHAKSRNARRRCLNRHGKA